MPKAEDITQLYLKLRRNLARSVADMVPPKEVEDIVQEAYVRVCQVGKSRGIRTPRSYLYRIVRNLALDYLKCSESRLADRLDQDFDNGIRNDLLFSDDTLERATSDEDFGHFCEAVRLLPVQVRRAFVLKKVYGYSQREIAREMRLSESTVEKHIALGIKRCAYYMQQFDWGETRTSKRSGDTVSQTASATEPHP